MTIEEKAKAYDKALERARRMNIGETTGAFGETVCEYIFPELKKSEDEKIIEEIIGFIFDKTSTYEERERSNTWLAWLEKQKSVEPTDLRTWKYIVDAVLTEKEGIGQYIDSPWTKKVAEKLQNRFGNIGQKQR